VADSPLVSVYLPTRNRAEQLPRAIRSVLRQDCPNLELLVVDDASTDLTSEVLARFAARDSRVRIFRQPVPSGAPAARNRAIREARGVFLAGIDDDDLMLPTRLSSLLDAYQDCYSLVCSARYVVSANRRWYAVRGGQRLEIGLDRLLTRNEVGNQALMRTDRVREIGMFDESQPAWQDYDLWTRLVARHGPALRLAEPTYVFFASAGPGTITNSAEAIDGAVRYFERFRHLMGSEQRKGQRLMQVSVARGRLTLAAARDCWSGATWRETLGYWVRSNLPWSADCLEGYRRIRRPLERMPASALALVTDTLP